jgi:(p)ppGpp synthase/HD superfamily hydrolase
MSMVLTVQDCRELARRAHAGQVDKQGRDYFTAHLEPIARLLVEHGDQAVMAGLLHDILEDTEMTAAGLLDLGVAPAVVRAVESVSKRPDESYEQLIERAAADPLGRLVKLADNSHNLAGNAELAESDPETAERLRAKYVAARATLLGHGPDNHPI